MKLLGIDTGGTFTDFVFLDAQKLIIHKVLSTPKAPEQAILTGIADLLHGKAVDDIYIIHGTTVATNSVLEGKGVKTALITNEGFRDLLAIGRQARSALYDFEPTRAAEPVPPELCLEIKVRLSSTGQVINELTDDDISVLRQRLLQMRPQAIAVNLLFSFLNDEQEKRLETALQDLAFISRSSAVLPEYREYERGIATWLNARVGPVMQNYLDRLVQALGTDKVSVMQSSGGTIKAAMAAKNSVNLLLSGPAGGLAAAKYVAAHSGRQRLLTFDMGGTSTDVALIEGDLQLTTEGSIGEYPVAVPMVDMHTIGAGGGSIAYIDDGGMLQVGPRSAGADPGPACYNKGGRLPTVTDANVVLGRISPEHFLGGRMEVRPDLAQQAVAQIADGLGLDLEQAAAGIIRVANEHMARALRVMSVQRGLAPASLCLVSFGGAGGLHVCALADALRIGEAMVPVHAGVLSALGMLVAPRSRQLSHSIMSMLEQQQDADIDGFFNTLVQQGMQALREEGIGADRITINRTLDLRYSGQSYSLNVPWITVAESVLRFHQLHRQRYGHDLDQAIELVNVRVGLEGPLPEIEIQDPESGNPSGVRAQTSITGLPVYARSALGREVLTGPALVTDPVSTTFVAKNWHCRREQCGSLILSKVVD